MFICVGSVTNTVTTLDNMVLRIEMKIYKQTECMCHAPLGFRSTLRFPQVRKAKTHEVRRQSSRWEGIKASFSSSQVLCKISCFFSCIKPREKKRTVCSMKARKAALKSTGVLERGPCASPPSVPSFSAAAGLSSRTNAPLEMGGKHSKGGCSHPASSTGLHVDSSVSSWNML